MNKFNKGIFHSLYSICIKIVLHFTSTLNINDWNENDLWTRLNIETNYGSVTTYSWIMYSHPLSLYSLWTGLTSCPTRWSWTTRAPWWPHGRRSGWCGWGRWPTSWSSVSWWSSAGPARSSSDSSRTSDVNSSSLTDYSRSWILSWSWLWIWVSR